MRVRDTVLALPMCPIEIALHKLKVQVPEARGRKPSYRTPEERAEARRTQGRDRQRAYLKRRKAEEAHGRASRSQER